MIQQLEQKEFQQQLQVSHGFTRLCIAPTSKWNSISFIQQIQELQQQPQALPHLDTGREQVSAPVEAPVDRKAPSEAIDTYQL